MGTQSLVKSTIGRALKETGAAMKHAAGVEIYATHRPTMMFKGVKPFKTEDTFIAPSASVIGDVTNWDESSVWYGAVVRADSNHNIQIGFQSNVQDRAVITTLSPKKELLDSGFPSICHIGHYVSVGAGSVLKSCYIENRVMIGEKCTIMEGAIVESNVILEPGTVVPPYARIIGGKRYGGNPAQCLGDLNGDEKSSIKEKSEKIHLMAQEHTVEYLPYGYSYVQLEELEKKGTETAQG